MPPKPPPSPEPKDGFFYDPKLGCGLRSHWRGLPLVTRTRPGPLTPALRAVFSREMSITKKLADEDGYLLDMAGEKVFPPIDSDPS